MGDFYCRICNVRKVAHEGDACPNCQDPYQVQEPAAPQQPASAQQAFVRSAQRQTEPQESEASGDRRMARRSGRQILGQPTPGAGAAHGARARQVYVAPQENVYTDEQDGGDEQPAYVQAPQAGGMQAPAAQTNQNAPVQTQGKRAPQTEGVVRNIQESKDESSVLERWMRAFMTGTPFPMTDDMMEFQVFSGWNSGVNAATGYSADKVIVYGKINSGKPVQDNSVRVYGVRNGGNEIIATDIENTTDGTFARLKPEPLSAIAVKLITFVVLGLLAFLVFGIISMMSGSGSVSFGISGQAITNLLTTLLLLVGGLMATVYFGKKSFAALKAGGAGLGSNLIYLLIALVVVSSAFQGLFG